MMVRVCRRESGTRATPMLGSMVQKGKLAACACWVVDFIRALKRVDLPTLGRPTMPERSFIVGRVEWKGRRGGLGRWKGVEGGRGVLERERKKRRERGVVGREVKAGVGIVMGVRRVPNNRKDECEVGFVRLLAD